MIVGGLLTAVTFRGNPFRGLSLFVQVTYMLIKMARHYYRTHPDAKKKFDKRMTDYFDRMYHWYVKPHESGQSTIDKLVPITHYRVEDFDG